MVMRGSIPFGTMYCTLTQSYCTELGHALDDEQFALDFVKVIKRKDDSIRTTKEKKILKEVKKLEKKTSRSRRYARREILKLVEFWKKIFD